MPPDFPPFDTCIFQTLTLTKDTKSGEFLFKCTCGKFVKGVEWAHGQCLSVGGKFDFLCLICTFCI